MGRTASPATPTVATTTAASDTCLMGLVGARRKDVTSGGAGRRAEPLEEHRQRADSGPHGDEDDRGNHDQDVSGPGRQASRTIARVQDNGNREDDGRNEDQDRATERPDRGTARQADRSARSGRAPPDQRNYNERIQRRYAYGWRIRSALRPFEEEDRESEEQRRKPRPSEQLAHVTSFVGRPRGEILPSPSADSAPE